MDSEAPESIRTCSSYRTNWAFGFLVVSFGPIGKRVISKRSSISPSFNGRMLSEVAIEHLTILRFDTDELAVDVEGAAACANETRFDDCCDESVASEFVVLCELL